MRKSQKTALIVIFASLHVILFLPSGPWRSFSIYLIPIEGIVLGPSVGFIAALLGSGIARLIKYDMWWMFGLFAEPLGAAAAGFLVKGKWKEITAIYGFMLAAYFTHPYGRMLPLWTVLDLLVAFAFIYPVSRIGGEVWGSKSRILAVSLLSIAFVSTVSDSMVRVFMLVPGGLYQLFGLSYDALAYEWFVPGAVGSYIEDLAVSVCTLAAGVPLVLSLRKILHLKEPLT